MSLLWPVCPNCTVKLDGEHIVDACVLSVFAGILRERNNLTDDEILARMENVDICAFSDELGPILDKLEAGEYAR